MVKRNCRHGEDVLEVLPDNKPIVIPEAQANEVKQSSPCWRLCPKCGISLPSFMAYGGHMGRHKKEENKEVRMCEVCGRLMNNSQALKNHMMIHTGDRPFVCEICGKGVALLTNNSQHTVFNASC